jgi:hypothetical protein
MSGSQRQKAGDKQDMQIRKLFNEIREGREEVLKTTEKLEQNINNAVIALNTADGMDNAIFLGPAQIERLISSFETNTFHACQSLEEVANHMTKYSNEQDDSKNDLLIMNKDIDDYVPIPPHILESEMKMKLAKSLGKMNDIFSKASKEFGILIAESQELQNLDKTLKENEKKNEKSNQDEVQLSLIPTLQRKILQLRKDLELAESQARSLSVQRYN